MWRGCLAGGRPECETHGVALSAADAFPHPRQHVGEQAPIGTHETLAKVAFVHDLQSDLGRVHRSIWAGLVGGIPSLSAHSTAASVPAVETWSSRSAAALLSSITGTTGSPGPLTWRPLRVNRATRRIRLGRRHHVDHDLTERAALLHCEFGADVAGQLQEAFTGR